MATARTSTCACHSSFVRSGVGLIGVLPPRVAEKLTDKGFDLSALKDLKGDKLNEALNTLERQH